LFGNRRSCRYTRVTFARHVHMSTPTSVSIPADILIHARWLLPQEHAGEVLEFHSLVIQGTRIAAIGPTARIRHDYHAEQELELDSHVVLPGLINAHNHAPMSLLRGYADDLPLQPWLEQKIWPAESRWLSESYVEDGARLAIAEMLLSGTTCFTDMYFFPDSIARVAEATGIRSVLASPILDFPTVWAGSADEYIARMTRLHDAYRHHERIRVIFGPHAPYTVSDAPLLKLAMLAEELDSQIHIHLHENRQEIDQAMAQQGMRPLSRLKQLDLIGPRLQAVHMTQLLDTEIVLLKDHKVNVIHCPSSNMKLASGICRSHDLLEAGVNVALGTDSCASNNNLDMFSEMKFACLLAKTATGNAAAMTAAQALQMATINGAIALGMEQDLGTLTPGKLADLIAVDLDAPNTLPVYDPNSTLVYSAHASQVSHVWVHGALLVNNHQLTSIDLQATLGRSKQWGDIIQGTPGI